jgi:hypothetical protein
VTFVTRRPHERVRLTRAGTTGTARCDGPGGGQGRRHEVFIGH